MYVIYYRNCNQTLVSTRGLPSTSIRQTPTVHICTYISGRACYALVKYIYRTDWVVRSGTVQLP